MKKTKKVIMMLITALLIMAVPASAQAAFKVTKSGVSLPSTIKKGATFQMKGTLKANEKMTKISCTIYNSNGKKCLQRYDKKLNGKTYNLKKADPYLAFDRLAAGKYYYRVCVYNAKGTKRRVVNRKFTVNDTAASSGSIKISNPLPSGDFTLNAGQSYSLSGTITSRYKMKKITAKILNSSNQVVYSKVSKPNSKKYSLKNSAIDSAMKFDALTAGTYTFQINAIDSEKNNVVLIKRSLTINAGSNNVSPGSTGSNNTAGNSESLDYSGIVTKPSGYKARTGRPAVSNPYYYNSSYNIYYKYNSLAPTGKKYYANYYVLGNCTWYACGRAMEIVASAGGNISRVQQIFGGDPVGIYNTNASKRVFSYGTSPKIGALAIFNYGASGDAHIAVVEDIVNGVPYVSESGYAFGTTVPAADRSNIVFKYQSIYNWAGGRQLLGYIYLI